MKSKVASLFKLILLIVSLAFVFIGQDTVGRGYLFLQLVGLAGIIGLLWDYNRKFV